jgi:hypothetical protein
MGSRRFYCTLADRNYLVRGLGLIESLRRHERRDYTLYFFCLDEITRTILTALALPNVVPIPLHAVEAGDDRLLATRADRTVVEYYWTLTPTLIRWILEREPTIDVITYLDSDLFFFSSPDPVYAELGSQSILIHEHRYTPELAYLLPESGRFNVGLLCFRRDRAGTVALDWWRERCLEWCYARSEAGKMGDQMYLDDWPSRFPGVVVLENVGAGLAPWNYGQYRITVRSAQIPSVLVNGGPVVFYHFHSLGVARPDVVLFSKHTTYPVTEAILRGCYVPYVETLRTLGAAVRAVLPSFSFGMNEPITVTPQHTLLVRESGAPADLGIGPCRRIPLDGGWHAQILIGP